LQIAQGFHGGFPLGRGTVADYPAPDAACTPVWFHAPPPHGKPGPVAAAILSAMGPAVSKSLPAVVIALVMAGGRSAASGPAAPPEWNPAFVEEALADARASGDARRGAGVFSVATSGCTACHRVAGAGGAVGPELTTIARCLSPEEIVESVYWPARSVKPEYRAQALALADGRVLQGIVKEETPETVVVVDARGERHEIAPADVEERTDVGSLMPANVFTALPAEQRRDLIRYLLELGRTPGLESLSHRPAAFDVPREPLEPEAWPNRDLWVNKHRVYDAYTKQARQFLGRDPMPLLLPAFPGLDGGAHGHWGTIPWSTWDDERRDKGDQGTVQAWPLAVDTRLIPRAVNVRLGDAGELAGCFDPDTLQFEATWSGGFLKFAKARYGFLSPASPAGAVGERPAAAALPEGPRTYRGFYRHGARVVFAYAIGGVEYLDAPWVKDGALVREIAPAASHPLAHLVKGGPPRWPQSITTTGTPGSGAPYAVDTIAPPFDNPWGSLMFFGGHDFFSNGDAAVCTIQGDVWRVSGLDAGLRSVRWRRIAAGLNQALGLVVTADVVHVLCGDQLTRLDDTNGDGEADFYACVTNRFEPSGGHNFKCGLERDAAGNFFTASHQGLLRISPDGQTIDVLAVGFRNPDGLGLLPDGAVTVPVSEGDWANASAICEVRQQPGQPPASPPPDFRARPPALPLVYLPRGLDHSSGGQAYVSSDRWGPLGGQLLHFSFGSCTHFLVLRDEVAGRPQGAIVPLVGDFRSGVHRGRFSPADGQLYVSGMNGWHVYGVDDGCFQRVRYTGGTVQQPVGIRAHRNGVLLRFSAPLDRGVAGDAANHFAQCWNYRYGPAYGSPEYSPSHYGTVGHDPLAIRSATVLADGRSLFLELPDLEPVNQLHLHVGVGPDTTRDVFATVHALDEPFRDIPHFREPTRPVAAHPLLRDMAMLEAAVKNPWLAKLEGARPIAIEAASNLAYKTPELRAAPGETLALTFVNPDVVPHNWVLVKPGALAAVGAVADGLIADPAAVARQYVPKTDDVVAYADITEPGKSQTIFFTVPDAPGRYPFLCTFPGHWKLMNGVMIVE
jgi:putative heme-binding domain-containing protein